MEQALLEQLRALDYNIKREEDIGPDGQRPERESHDEVVLKKRFEDAVARLNPGLPLEARQDAVRRVTVAARPVSRTARVQLAADGRVAWAEGERDLVLRLEIEELTGRRAGEQ